MYSFFGKALNKKDGEILGRISSKALGWLNREKRNTILKVEDFDINPKGYLAVITSKDINGNVPNLYKNVPILYSIKQFDKFVDGDIVLLEFNKNMGTILYERNSHTNAILVTEKCNNYCLSCPQPPKDDSFNRTQFNKKLIRLMDKNTEYLGITGGEPTLMGDELLELINECKISLPKTHVHMLTNGRWYKNEKNVQKLAEIRHPKFSLGIPIFADTDKEHDYLMGAKNSLIQTIDGLYNLAKYRQSIEIRVVITKLNCERLPQIAEFIYQNFPFVAHIALMGMEPTGLAAKNIDELWVDPCDYMPKLEEATFYLSRRFMHVSIYNHQLCILPQNLWPFARQSISTWKNVYFSECKKCDIIGKCGGFFVSMEKKHSKNIRAVKLDSLKKPAVKVP